MLGLCLTSPRWWFKVNWLTRQNILSNKPEFVVMRSSELRNGKMRNWLTFLSVIGPLAILCHFLGASPTLTFLCSAAALVPLGAIMENSTEEVADHLGPKVGGLLNATLGNAPELIIACMALSKGLQDVVKASITGSILGNLLFANGISMVFGGWGRPMQRFSHETAGLNSGLLFLAIVALIVPAMFDHTTTSDTEISVQVSVVLITVYLLSLFYVMSRQPGTPLPDGATHHPIAEATDESVKSIWRPLGILALATIGVALMSEILTDAIEPTAKVLGLTTTFTGVFLLASAGNIAQTFNAVQFARDDNMELTLSTTVGSSTQVALLVAPVLVFVSILMGNPMNLVFSRLELFGLLVATMVTRNATSDGVSNWMEGVLLVGVYALLGIAFFAV
jgi:Ca2+:H+ antiporter